MPVTIQVGMLQAIISPPPSLAIIRIRPGINRLHGPRPSDTDPSNLDPAFLSKPEGVNIEELKTDDAVSPNRSLAKTMTSFDTSLLSKKTRKS